MKNWVVEFLIVFVNSTRMQVAFLLGIVAFTITHSLGWYFIENANDNIQFGALRELFVHKLGHRYDKAALFFLVSSWCLVFKLFRKERNRI